MICPHCHTENRSGAKFCDECGTRLVPESAPEETQTEKKTLEGVPNISASGYGMTTPERAFSYEPVDEFNDDEPVAQQEIADEIDDALPLPESENDVVPNDSSSSKTGNEQEDSGGEETEVDENAAEPAETTDNNADDSGNRESDDAPQAASLEASETCDLGNALSDLDIKDNDKTHVLNIPELRSVALEAEKTQAIGPKPSVPKPRATSGADLSGFDEFLVNPGYVPPKSAWSAGDTMQMPRIEGVEPPKQKDFKAPDAHKSTGRSKKIALIIALVLAIAAAGAAGVTYYLEMWGGKVIPDVTGMTQSDATYLLQNKGFTVRATTVPSDSTEGLVLLMDPGAGARQEEGSEVVIHVSTSRTVPAVVGKIQDDAAKALADSGFENVTIATERSDEAEGTVLSVDPGEGQKAKASTAITLTVAEAYTVPDITGMTYREAVSAIEDAGLQAASTYTYNETVPEGSLLGCDPQAGSKVTSDTVVTINIAKSRGSELTQAARSYLASNTLKASDNSAFSVSSVDSVTYQGNNTVSFTATGRASTSVTVLGQTLSVSGDSKQVSGTITFDSSDNVTSVSFQ